MSFEHTTAVIRMNLNGEKLDINHNFVKPLDVFIYRNQFQTKHSDEGILKRESNQIRKRLHYL